MPENRFQPAHTKPRRAVSRGLTFVALLSVVLNVGNAHAHETPLRSGISGMANIDRDTYLAVHDLKANEDGTRLTVIHSIPNMDYVVVPVQVAGWDDKSKRSSDLEAVCSLANHDDQFLLLESGNWNDKKGRLFRVSLDVSATPHRATVIGTHEMEIFNAKGDKAADRTIEGDEFEGLACFHRSEGRYLVLLAERGGSAPHPHGVIRWFDLDLDSGKGPVWSAAGKRGVTVIAPGDWADSSRNRDISALHVKDNVLWAAASEEFEAGNKDPRKGTTGPFYSVIYRVGEVDVNAETPIRDPCAEDEFDCTGETPSSPYTVWRDVAGFKVEGLAGPPQSIGRSTLSIGTEDERFGGAWRPIR